MAIVPDRSGLVPSDAEIAACLTSLAMTRGVGKTFCPSEPARILAPDDWRGLMPCIRRVAAELWVEGRLAAYQRGVPVNPEWARGPIRLGLRRVGGG